MFSTNSAWELAPPAFAERTLRSDLSCFLLIVDRLVHHRYLVHESRREDRSEVEALFVEARMVEPRAIDPDKLDDYAKKTEQLNQEVKRLEDLGARGWTEYQVLSLNQSLVEFLKVDDLKARARSSLVDLEDYATDSAYRYDAKQYDDWKARIDNVIGIADKKKPKGQDAAAEPLRAELRTLLEHVASYNKNWAEGKSIVRALITVGAIAIPILLAMGLLPILHPAGKQSLEFYNWGLLGTIGSLAVVLRDLRRSDLVEIGNTAGRKELWRTVLGSALGLLAGVLTFAMISGGLFTGHIIPNVGSTRPEDVGLSILWAIGSGYSFERVFDRMSSATEGRSE